MGGIGPFCKKSPFCLHFQVISRFHFSKRNQKVKQKVAEKELKMVTVNDPNTDRIFGVLIIICKRLV